MITGPKARHSDFKTQTKTSIGTLSQRVEVNRPLDPFRLTMGGRGEEWTEVMERKSGFLAAKLGAELGIRTEIWSGEGENS